MFKINRTTEYGLIAMQHMNRKTATGDVTSAREIADSYGLPFEITAKTLQRLKDTGLIQSAQGAKGGYTLQRSLSEITLAEFLKLMEGPQSVVVCTGSSHKGLETPHGNSDPNACEHKCEYEIKCEIKHLMNNLNAKVFQFLSNIHLAELTSSPSAARAPGLATSTIGSLLNGVKT